MTKIKFFKKNGNILGFEISGHSGYASAGKDIVCAAISSISQTACLGITDVLKINATVTQNDNKGFLSLILPLLKQKDNEKAQVILSTMERGLLNLCEQYSRYIKMEVQDEIY